MTQPDFEKIHSPTPAFDEVTRQYDKLNQDWNAATSQDERLKVVQQWDQLRKDLETWEALVHLRFNQDTTNSQYQRDREYCDQLRPKLTELAVDLKRKLLESSHRDSLVTTMGQQCFSLWESDVLTYQPSIEQGLVRESELEAQYNQLTAGAEISFRGKTYNLSTIARFREDPDRSIRHQANQVTWRWFAENRSQLDDIYTELVNLRTAMAHQLGFNNFVELGYKRMNRIDYNAEDVTRYRDAVRDHVVPLCVELRKAQAKKLGVDPLTYWDEPVHDLAGNPRPAGDHDWLLGKAQEMFDAMNHGLADFFKMMVQGKFMDLKVRQGKAGGGFCTSFPTPGVPFIFANFNGTKGDVEVFTHEVGHAFQCYMSRDQNLIDYLWPTYESCEIHSMSLEFLTWPYMEKFFEQDADRFRRIHLAQSLLFLPYGVAVDHFQHLVYQQASASPDDRHQMWQEVEQIYLPWRRYEDIEHLATGGQWQMQRHIYLDPFYYIDYTLAQTCALQFWQRSQENYAEAMQSYVKLCRRGGEAPFQELCASADLVSPFKEGCLTKVVAAAQRTLGM